MQEEKRIALIRRRRGLLRMGEALVLVLVIVLVIVLSSEVHSQAPASATSAPSVQEIVERMDRHLACPDGFGRGEISVQREDGSFAFHPFQLYCRDRNRLFLFHRPTGALEAKLLFLSRGEGIWQLDAMRNRILRLDGNLRYGVLFQSGFTFEDVSGFSLEGNYDPVAPPAPPTGSEGIPENLQENAAGDPPRKPIWLRPLLGDRGERIAVFYDAAKEGAPIRIDSYERNGLFTRSRRFFYEPLPEFKGRTPGESFPGPSRIVVMDWEHHTISRMELRTFDSRVTPDPGLFEPGMLRP